MILQTENVEELSAENKGYNDGYYGYPKDNPYTEGTYLNKLYSISYNEGMLDSSYRREETNESH